MLERLYGKGKTPALLMGMQAGSIFFGCLSGDLSQLGNNLLYYPVIPILGIYTKDTQSCHKDMSSTVFIAALLIIARNWKQPKRPLTKEW